MDEGIRDSPPPKWLSVTGQPLDLDLPHGFLGTCSSISNFERIDRLGEGTYGVVSRARDTRTSKIVALKEVRIDPNERQDGIPITTLREISILRSLKHRNIINVFDVAIGTGPDPSSKPNGRQMSSLDEIHMVMEYAGKGVEILPFLRPTRIWQVSQKDLRVDIVSVKLLEGLDYLHKNDIIHRDLKLENLLVTSRNVLKIADFGMSRTFSHRPLTAGVVTIWYRAPELLLGATRYTPAIDLWSAGLILAELLLSEPTLPGDRPLEQLGLTVKLLGSPTGNDLNSLSDMGCPMLMAWERDLLPRGRADNLERRFLERTSPLTVRVLANLLRWDPLARWTAAETLGRRGRGSGAATAESWWNEKPHEVAPEEMFDSLESSLEDSNESKQERGLDNRSTTTETAKVDLEGYVFDFEDKSEAKRAVKRHRAW